MNTKSLVEEHTQGSISRLSTKSSLDNISEDYAHKLSILHFERLINNLLEKR